MYAMTPWVQRILIANVVMYFVTSSSPGLARDLMFYPPIAFTRPWTLVTYMFLHAGFSHLFFNMIGLFFFGPRLEARIGGSAFLRLYFLAGIGGALFQAAFATAAPMVGASGAVYAVLVGFAYFYPRETILLFPIPIPIQAWLLVTGYVVISLYQGITGSGSGVAHFAHLGGAAVGFAFLKWWEWRRGAGKRDFQKKMSPQPSGGGGGFVSERAALARWRGISVEALHELNRDEVRRLLEKVNTLGAGSLTDAERSFLDRMVIQ
jgi:membrane associated rhomboid family serine protease